jgi:flagellin
MRVKIASGVIASLSGGGMSNFTTKIARSVVKLTSGIYSGETDAVAIASSNLSAAGSRITDADTAREIIEFTKAGILSGVRTSLCGQANQSQQKVLNLIQ